jgi:hypothetical protein
MSNSELQAKAFYKQVAATRCVWTIRDEAGIPVPECDDDTKAMPFWSSRSLAELIIQNVPDYNGFYPIEISWQDFKEKWGPGLTRDGLLAGINWAGSTASGPDIMPDELIKNVETAIRNAI